MIVQDPQRGQRRLLSHSLEIHTIGPDEQANTSSKDQGLDIVLEIHGDVGLPSNQFSIVFIRAILIHKSR
jgi:hypothetical protein